jgi:diguanylate cyclase (GGDEF)-like protein
MGGKAFMRKDVHHDSVKTFIKPIRWCRYIVNVGYATAALMVLAHVIWFFAARSVLAFPPDIYLRDYIILPAVGFFTLMALIDLSVRSRRFTLLVKEYLSLSVFILFSFYLCLTHAIATVLLGSFILPIFASTIFSNVKMTRWMFVMSSAAAMLTGVKACLQGKLDSSMLMQIFVACFMFLCSYLLSNVLIRHSHDHLAALIYFDNQQRHMQEQLKLDLFTGLYNRKTFEDSLRRLAEECGSANQFLSLAMLDVDHFKCVNDRYGHAEGDRVLLYLSQLLKKTQNENIDAFRTGGDEFAVLFQNYTEKEAYRICEDLRTRMEYASLRNIGGKAVTFSCGLACVIPRHIDLDRFKKAADSALYEAKNSSRNRIVVDHGLTPRVGRSPDG